MVNLLRRNVVSLPGFCISHPFSFIDGEKSIGCWYRKQEDKNSSEEIFYLNKSHIISPKDEFIDLSKEDYKRAMELTIEHWEKRKKEGEPSYPNGQIVRNEIRNPDNPLFLIYLFDPKGTKLPVTSNPIVGYAISFPKSNFNSYLAFTMKLEVLDRFNFDYEAEIYDDED